MSIFKPLGVPQEEIGRWATFCGKWFVFIEGYNDNGDDCNFLHIDGEDLCKLRKDEDNGHIMFDTELEAFSKSFNFYMHHGKSLEYPWMNEYITTLKAKADNIVINNESKVMEFE